MPGHLFVLQGDLTRLACDAVVLPCDDALNITRLWQPLLPPGLPKGDSPEWLRLPVEDLEGNIVRLPDVDKRRVRASITLPASNLPRSTPETVANRVVAGVRTGAKDLQPQGGRHLPLVAVPLVGTGAGGLNHRRGEVIQALIPRLREAADGFDIALVLLDRRDLAAAQQARTDHTDWLELTGSLRSAADRLGVLAGHGQLSLFIGAGASKPVGLPDWWTLLKDLADDAGISVDWGAATDPLETATPIVNELGERFHQAVASKLDCGKHGIGHALLAGLRVQQMVTTNFDPCMELALDAPLEGRYRVLTRNLADSSMPWLLKLHGDIHRPGSLVLSGADYKAHAQEYAALRGVVQSLMLTSHLLFIGFSMTDRSFLDMAAAVARVREDAETEGGPTLPTAGTALALTSSLIRNHDLEEELDFIPMVDRESEEFGARILEIFLDRLAWAAATTHELSAEYLLDTRYASGLKDPDKSLVDALVKFQEELPEKALASPGWDRIRAALISLGDSSPSEERSHLPSLD